MLQAGLGWEMGVAAHRGPLLRILTAEGSPAQTLGTRGVRERLVLSWRLAGQSQGWGGTLSPCQAWHMGPEALKMACYVPVES